MTSENNFNDSDYRKIFGEPNFSCPIIDDLIIDIKCLAEKYGFNSSLIIGEIEKIRSLNSELREFGRKYINKSEKLLEQINFLKK